MKRFLPRADFRDAANFFSAATVAGPDKWVFRRGRTMTKMPPDKLLRSQGTTPAAGLKGPGLGGRVRNWFLAGVIVAGPLATTAYIVWWFVDTIDSLVKRLVPCAVLAG